MPFARQVTASSTSRPSTPDTPANTTASTSKSSTPDTPPTTTASTSKPSTPVTPQVSVASPATGIGVERPLVLTSDPLVLNQSSGKGREPVVSSEGEPTEAQKAAKKQVGDWITI